MTIQIKLNEDQLRYIIVALEGGLHSEAYLSIRQAKELLERLQALEEHIDDVYDMEAKRLIRGE